MSLSNRLLLMVCILMGLYAFLVYGVQRLIIMPDFENLERNEGERNVERTYEVLTKKIGDVEEVGHTIAERPTIIEGISTKNVDLLNKNLDVSFYLQTKVSLIYIFDLEGNLLWGKAYELDTLKQVYLPNFRRQLSENNNYLLKHNSIYNATGGLFLSDLGPMLIVSLPIHDETNILGTIIIGRLVDSDLINTISSETKIPVNFWPQSGSVIPRNKLAIFELLKKNPGIYREEEVESIHLYSLLLNVNDKPSLLMEITLPKDITNQAQQTLFFTFLMLFAAAVVIIFVLYLSLQRIVVRPLVILRKHISEIREKNDFSRTLNLKRTDEIGKLVEEFNGMMDQLNTARSSLLEQSRYSTLAHVASNVLNSVRNSIKPLILTIDAIKSRFHDMSKKGQTPSEEEQLALDQKLEKLLEEANAIMKVVSIHDSLNDQMEVLADIKLNRIVAESVELVPKELKSGIKIEISPTTSHFRPGHTHRSALRQIVTELLSNGAQSIQRAHRKDGRISITVSVAEGSAGSQMHLQVTDNGEGIAPENLEKIFQNNTKIHRTTDVLHPDLRWCHTTASAMNGKIYATSKGLGEGASFHLIMPCSVA